MTSCPEIPLPISKSAKRMSVDNIFMSTFLLLSSPPLVAEYKGTVFLTERSGVEKSISLKLRPGPYFSLKVI